MGADRFGARAQEDIEVHGELNELNLLSLDFSRELLKKRLLVQFRADDEVESALIMVQKSSIFDRGTHPSGAPSGVAVNFHNSPT